MVRFMIWKSPKSKVQSLTSKVFSLRDYGTACRPPASDLRPPISASGGFSLLELMAVMLLMFIMMGIATTAFRGLMRGAGLRGAASTVRGTLTLARQHAMNNGQRVAVILYQGQDVGDLGTMRTVMSFGRVHSVVGAVIVTENELPWRGSEVDGATVYSFRNREGMELKEPDFDNEDDQAKYERLEFEVEPMNFLAGDEVAFEIGARRDLPSGLRFDFGGSDDFMIIIFNADGSADSDDYAFEIRERGGSAAAFLVSIDSATGRITIDDIIP